VQSESHLKQDADSKIGFRHSKGEAHFSGQAHAGRPGTSENCKHQVSRHSKQPHPWPNAAAQHAERFPATLASQTTRTTATSPGTISDHRTEKQQRQSAQPCHGGRKRSVQEQPHHKGAGSTIPSRPAPNTLRNWEPSTVQSTVRLVDELQVLSKQRDITSHRQHEHTLLTCKREVPTEVQPRRMHTPQGTSITFSRRTRPLKPKRSLK
jgi:hypothetical protein